jgi:RNA polymerase sigma-70 factor (ECF subfamily)
LGLFYKNENSFIESLYNQYGIEIYKICYSYIKIKSDAEDCLQEVFYRAMTKVNDLKKHPAPDKWLFVTARLVSLEKLRTTNSRRELDISGFENILQSETFEDELLRQQYTDEEIILLRNDILEQLNEKERELYTMRYIEKLGVDIISEQLKINYSNTTTRLNRLKMKIIKLAAKIFCD